MRTIASPHAFCASKTSSFVIGTGSLAFVNARVPATAPPARASGPSTRAARMEADGSLCCDVYATKASTSSELSRVESSSAIIFLAM